MGAHNTWEKPVRAAWCGDEHEPTVLAGPLHLVPLFLQFTRARLPASPVALPLYCRPANFGQDVEDEEPGETIETTCAGERSLPDSSPRGCTGR